MDDTYESGNHILYSHCMVDHEMSRSIEAGV